MELYGFMEREKKIPSYFFIITKKVIKSFCLDQREAITPPQGTPSNKP